MAPEPSHIPSVFEGLPADELEPLLDRLERRHFAAGSTVIAAGDVTGELYIVQAGVADVFMTDEEGVEHRINRVIAGGTLGEIALLTNGASSATVRAGAPLDVLVLAGSDLQHMASLFPGIYRNLGAILSERLIRSNRQAIAPPLGRVTVLADFGGPPILGYALACSVAWHTRAPTLLVMLGDQPPPELEALAAATTVPTPPESISPRNGGDRPEPRAAILFTAATGPFTSDHLAVTLEHLCQRYDHVLVQRPRGSAPALAGVHLITFRGASDAITEDGRYEDRVTIRGWSQSWGAARPDANGVLHVPALEPDENEWLRRGLLPSTGRAGRVLGWAARNLSGLKVGLALGAGGSKGFAHVGVLKAFEEIGLQADYVAGTSIGACVAALYCLGHTPTQILKGLEHAAASTFRLTLPFRSLLSNASVRAVLRAVGGDARIEDLAIPLAVSAADLNTRGEVIFRRGLAWSAVLASLTMPGVYPAQSMGAHTLVDGGLVNPVPVSAVARMGADVIIAVKLGGGRAAAQEVEAVEPSGRVPSVLEVIVRSFEIMQGKISNDLPEATTIVIAPDFGGMKELWLHRFREGQSYVELGETAARAALPRLTAALPWLRH